MYCGYEVLTRAWEAAFYANGARLSMCAMCETPVRRGPARPPAGAPGLPAGGGRGGSRALAQELADGSARAAGALVILDQRKAHEALAARPEADARRHRDPRLLQQRRGERHGPHLAM